MKLYRLTQKKFSDTPFSPAGAKQHGGRWNSKGTEALYFSQSESLCILEVCVHIKNDPSIKDLYDLYRIDLPTHLIAKLEKEDLPPTWQNLPASEQTQQIGDEFLTISPPEFAALQVPSIISPRDNNYIINPNHAAIKNLLKKSEKLAFKFDTRIFV